MRRSPISLRRALLALAFTGSLSFGATQALAVPEQPTQARGNCPATGYDYYYAPCNSNVTCPPWQSAYCSWQGYCRCGDVP
jgi:hypothetical protein